MQNIASNWESCHGMQQWFICFSYFCLSLFSPSLDFECVYIVYIAYVHLMCDDWIKYSYHIIISFTNFFWADQMTWKLGKLHQLMKNLRCREKLTSTHWVKILFCNRNKDIWPVSMLSLTIQVPWMSAASQGMIIPLAGIMMTSPGTRSVDMACSMSENSIRKKWKLQKIIGLTHNTIYNLNTIIPPQISKQKKYLEYWV